MAAVRRSSNGLIAALVIFIILTVVGVGGAIWSFVTLREAEQAIQVTQKDFHDAVQPVFSESNWELPVQTPTEFGVRYARESFAEVAAKLKEAAEYEKVVKPMVGWDSVGAMQTAMGEYAVQKQAAEQGEPLFQTLRLLLDRYDGSYQSLTARAAELTGQLETANEQLAKARGDLAKTREDLQAQNSQNLRDFQQKLGGLQEANADLQARVEEHRREVVSWQQRHQEEVNARRTEVAAVQAGADEWRKMYEEAVAAPDERQRLAPDGKILEARSDHDFVVIEGGADRGRMEDQTYVVFAVNPDGSARRKGTILVGRVLSHTALASVLDEEGGYVLVNDPFVSEVRWREHTRRQTAAAE
ncbi:MAG: hypothetical protein GXY74_08200 [Phycisphaerae bacterium]|nr:hypothetical protein [Phycisphaerae bacterium]